MVEREEAAPGSLAAMLRRRADTSTLWIEVTGDSMGRSIAPGARVEIQTARAPRRGEIWAFVDAAGSIVVHRFRSERDGLVWLRGDANGHDDDPVAPDALVGRVVTVVDRRGTHHLAGWRRWPGRLRLDVNSSIRVLRRLRARVRR